MTDFLNIKSLEKRFADDFSSPIFPVLANFYFNNNDLARAKKVCEIGLKNVPNNYNGKFVLSKILVEEGNFLKAEKLLKEVLKNDPINIASLRLLIKISKNIKRSNNTITKYIKKILDLLPNDSESIKWLHNNDDTILKETTFIPKRGRAIPKSQKSIEPHSIDEKSIIQPNMATLTMAHILINQKYYKQALNMLNDMQHSGSDAQKITELKNKINKLMLNEETI
tara:strand:- start:647 stop:1321 length:675 start_codon:yes stop_codon:yes gene_type:complete